jgi:phosphatidylglycerol:prolipoprotein diacylglycerol transferase
MTLGTLSWPILERIPLVGDLAVSPHGIGIAAGFLAGAVLAVRQARRRGVARRHVDNIAEIFQDLAIRGAIGAILGARVGYVATHTELFASPVEWLFIWEGGLSLLGAVAGGVLASLPYVIRRRFDVRLLLDSVAPGLALGIFVGRIGDLVIGEHLGTRTDFALGWRCTGALRDPAAPYPWPGEPQVGGCFDVAVHQTALYDFLAGGLVSAVLLLLARKPRFDGFFAATFAVLYGGARMGTDFARAADQDLLGTLTGSQLAAMAVVVAVLGWVAVARPWQRQPWGWSPPSFAHGWGELVQRDPDGGDGRSGEDSTDTPAGPTAGAVGESETEREQ